MNYKNAIDACFQFFASNHTAFVGRVHVLPRELGMIRMKIMAGRSVVVATTAKDDAYIVVPVRPCLTLCPHGESLGWGFKQFTYILVRSAVVWAYVPLESRAVCGCFI